MPSLLTSAAASTSSVFFIPLCPKICIVWIHGRPCIVIKATALFAFLRPEQLLILSPPLLHSTPKSECHLCSADPFAFRPHCADHFSPKRHRRGCPWHQRRDIISSALRLHSLSSLDETEREGLLHLIAVRSRYRQHRRRPHPVRRLLDMDLQSCYLLVVRRGGQSQRGTGELWLVLVALGLPGLPCLPRPCLSISQSMHRG